MSIGALRRVPGQGRWAVPAAFGFPELGQARILPLNHQCGFPELGQAVHLGFGGSPGPVQHSPQGPPSGPGPVQSVPRHHSPDVCGPAGGDGAGPGTGAVGLGQEPATEA